MFITYDSTADCLYVKLEQLLRDEYLNVEYNEMCLSYRKDTKKPVGATIPYLSDRERTELPDVLPTSGREV